LIFDVSCSIAGGDVSAALHVGRRVEKLVEGGLERCIIHESIKRAQNEVEGALAPG
jgi:hypothetical protein